MEESINQPGPQENQPGSGELTDRVGAVASSLCAIHCAVCAIFGAWLIAEGYEELVSHELEWGLTLFAIGFGAVALYWGWRQHRSKLVAGLLVLGMVSLLTSRALEMGSDHEHGHGDHHGHHEEEHHGEKEGSEHHASGEHADENHEGEKHEGEKHEGEKHEGEEKHAEHADEHHGDGDALHDIGAAAGVGGGLLLFLGHIFNIVAVRRWRDECCP